MLDWTSAGNGALLWGSTAPKRRQRTGTREWLALAGSGWCDDGVAYLGGPHGESQSSALGVTFIVCQKPPFYST